MGNEKPASGLAGLGRAEWLALLVASYSPAGATPRDRRERFHSISGNHQALSCRARCVLHREPLDAHASDALQAQILILPNHTLFA